MELLALPKWVCYRPSNGDAHTLLAKLPLPDGGYYHYRAAINNYPSLQDAIDDVTNKLNAMGKRFYPSWPDVRPTHII